MQKPYSESLANYIGSESCGISGNNIGSEALTGVRAGWVLSLEMKIISGADVLEDKIVQRATVEVLNAVYDVYFRGFSYGFRPGRSQHNALDAVTVALECKKVSCLLDVDIRGFFDAIDREWMVRFVEHRITDKRVVRHIRKWLKAGVLEDGRRLKLEEGIPQGGSVSRLLSNIYLHYVFNLWANNWRRKAEGDVIMVRFANEGPIPKVQSGAACREDQIA
jgi:RNA-directed DNA polymerase